MANIDKLNFSFTDGQTTITANHLNSFVDRINKLIDAVGGDTPTPTQTVATPTISISGTTATISCSTSGATIYYTTNGNTPTTSSTHYTGAITLSGACTIKAIAVKSGMNNSSVASQSYTPIVVKGTIVVEASPSGGGVVTGSGEYEHASQVPITATANENYRFVSWNDGSTTPSRTVTVIGNQTKTYTATFEAIEGYEWKQSAYSATGERTSNPNFVSTGPIDILSGATRVRLAVSNAGANGVSLGLMLFAGSTPLERILVVNGSTEVVATLSEHPTATKAALMFSSASGGGKATDVSDIDTIITTYGMSVEGLEGNL